MSRKPNTVCFECKNPCYVRPSQMAIQSTWFCSSNCRFKESRKPRYTCQNCGIVFWRPVKPQAPKYCSVSCSNKARTGIKYTGERENCLVTVVGKRRAFCRDRDGDLCLECKNPPIWNGKHITLQVDHIDGDRNNNDPSNWRLLCPNCHSQTETFGTKNRHRYN